MNNTTKHLANSNLYSTRFNPIINLRYDSLSRALDGFDKGCFAPSIRIFEAILQRDDLISGLALKRKKSISRLDYEIVQVDDSPKAKKHANILKQFYQNIKVESLVDKNIKGSLRLLIAQMMDAVSMKYNAHKIEYYCKNNTISAKFTQYPLYLFENRSCKLRLLENEHQLSDGIPLRESEWLIATGDGLMQASSLAYLFKQLPLRDWLTYCERNGMPGIKAKTDAFPGSQQWENVCKAVNDFGAEFTAVLSEGTDIEAIDVSTSGQLPYKDLIDRTDKMLCSLWRGSDLSTLSSSNATGASMQYYESSLIEEDDAANISEALNEQVDKTVIKLALGEEIALAKFKLKLPDYELHKDELEIIERLSALGLQADPNKLAKIFAFPILEEKVEENSKDKEENQEAEKEEAEEILQEKNKEESKDNEEQINTSN
ncbi:MAG: DUF935 family protein [Opitutales bacterium]